MLTLGSKFLIYTLASGIIFLPPMAEIEPAVAEGGIMVDGFSYYWMRVYGY